MGLTGKERHWIQLSVDLHHLFCDCGDPITHLTRCLMDITEEEQATAAAIAELGLGTAADGEPDSRGTTPGDTAAPAAAG
ncbi:ORF2 [torque teno Delphinidae virus 29]